MAESRRQRLPQRGGVATPLVLILVVLGWGVVPACSATGSGSGTLELDTKSEYSHIRVRRHGDVRKLIFVRDNGDEAVETQMNLKRPYELLTPYCRTMFASYVFQPRPQRVLLIGLGGGAMVHFLQHYDPELKIDAVEIDPVVVDVARRWFELKPSPNTLIFTEDAFGYLDKTRNQYDVIYMDAFLKPSQGTDATGVPLRMKTVEFYKGLRTKVAAEGLVVFNINRHKDVQEDLKMLREVFEQVHVLRAGPSNLVVIGSWSKTRVELSELRSRARELDRRFKATFSFADLLAGLSR